MEGKTIGIIALVIIILGGGWYLLSRTPASTPTTTSQSSGVSSTTTTTTTTTTAGVTVAYTSQGFSPKNVTVPLGTTVTFVNQTSKDMWIGSAQHPAHQGYDGTTLSQHCAAGYTGLKPFDQCSASASYSFTFTKVGIWPYHNHDSAGDFGTITVTAAPAAGTTVTSSTTVQVL